MSFWKQLWDAVRGQIEDFFDGKSGAVAALSLLVALLIFGAWWRITHAMSGHHGSYWVVAHGLTVLIWAALWRARCLLKP